MSTTFYDISYDLVDGIYDVLNTHVVVGSVTYPVYKSVPKTPADNYVYVGGVIQTEEGTKDEFLYSGTVQIRVTTGGMSRGDKKLAQSILSVVRQHLKPAKSSVFSIGSRTLVVFSHASMTDIVEQDDSGISKVNIIDLYNFLIQ